MSGAIFKQILSLYPKNVVAEHLWKLTTVNQVYHRDNEARGKPGKMIPDAAKFDIKGFAADLDKEYGKDSIYKFHSETTPSGIWLTWNVVGIIRYDAKFGKNILAFRGTNGFEEFAYTFGSLDKWSKKSYTNSISIADVNKMKIWEKKATNIPAGHLRESVVEALTHRVIITSKDGKTTHQMPSIYDQITIKFSTFKHGKPVIVTGHSLGGAFAETSTVLYSLFGPAGWDFTVVKYGGLPSLDQGSEDYLKKQKIKVESHVNKGDIVSRLVGGAYSLLRAAATANMSALEDIDAKGPFKNSGVIHENESVPIESSLLVMANLEAHAARTYLAGWLQQINDVNPIKKASSEERMQLKTLAVVCSTLTLLKVAELAIEQLLADDGASGPSGKTGDKPVQKN
ncbi:hypothetical protein TWF694_000262 [Orbilia ellipsospora]|uniref:Fungal lipase-type domain-containing protein n=1 Tax=Orbilia ellipsospora TaxID=2528407 RepID=A0AAV9XPU3_9PEZI